MRRFIIGAAILVSVLLSVQAFGQQNARVDGIITDATQAVLPGVTVTATNVETGIARTAVSNAAGVYSFVGMQVGKYTIKAELAGFQTATYKDVNLGNDARLALNITMAVKALEQKVEVSVQSENLLIESSSSAGMVLPEKKVGELPLVNSNVLSLIKVMGGVTISENPIFGADDTQFAGVSAANINLQRDGVTVNDVRYATGLNSPVYLNPEMVGEFKLVLSPVDAEMGRGNGQVQVITRSGANAFHGSGVWNVQNTALDANEWVNNATSARKDWRNQNEYTVSVGGPIIKNKTFFFASWDQQFSLIKQPGLNFQVPTACARKGIFRYFDYWSGGNEITNDSIITSTSAPPSTTVAYTARTVQIDGLGTPRVGLMTPFPTSSTMYRPAALHYVNIFTGPLLKNPTTNDCSDVTMGSTTGLPTSDWASQTLLDSYRTPDADATLGTGTIARMTEWLPLPNNFVTGDGLNWGGYRYTRRLVGGDNIYGLGEGPYRKQINVRIDHNFTAAHRVSGTYSYESDHGEDSFPTMPTGSYGGSVIRKPQSFSVNLTSTLRPTLLNEARTGLSRTASFTNDPLFNPINGDGLRNELKRVYPNTYGPDGDSLPVIIGLGYPGFCIGCGGVFAGVPQMHAWGNGRGNMAATWGGKDPRWVFADTLTWTKGKHSFKFGAEHQRSQSYQSISGAIAFTQGASGIPYVGNTSFIASGDSRNLGFHNLNTNAPDPINAPLAAGSPTLGNVLSGIYNYLNMYSGNVTQLRQFRFVAKPTDTTYNDITAGQDRRVIDFRQNMFSFFAKDDWKITESLTLNLGVRWDWYGVPYLKGGMTSGVEGGAQNIFGLSGNSMADWMMPGTVNSDGSITYKGTNTRLAFIGPGSDNPDQLPFPNDYNNFGPAVGFAWQLPWFGKGKTTLRGGYQVTYQPQGRATVVEMPRLTYQNIWSPTSAIPYLNLKMLRDNASLGLLPVVPLPDYIQTPAVKSEYSVRDRDQSVTVYDPNLRSPYIQNLTMSLTRNIGTNFTVDIRYVGTLSRKTMGTINLNSVNIWNNGLADAFAAARRGDTAIPLLDQMFRGVNLVGTGYGPVGTTYNGVFQTGAMHLRRWSTTRANLANGNYLGVASSLAAANYNRSYTGNSGLPDAGRDNGTLLRYTGFPENFIYTNPQFAGASWTGNFNHANYHSMQAQITMRPVQGFSFSGTWTWARNLGNLGFSDPRFRGERYDYGLNGQNRTHTITSNGAYELPFGPGRWMLNGNNGIVSRIVSGWQLSWIANYSTGRPFTISPVTGTTYGLARPDLVGPFDPSKGHVYWPDDRKYASYFWNFDTNDEMYTNVASPKCSSVTTVDSLNLFCSNRALALKSSPTTIIMDNPDPLTVGSLGWNRLTMPATWSADMAMSKAIRITEGKTIQFRVDATNIFNHQAPTAGSAASGVVRVRVPGSPVNTLGYYSDGLDGSFALRPIGYMSAKVGARTFQAKVRFDF